MKTAACKAFELEESEVQCWDYHQCSIQGNQALDADGTSPIAATLKTCNILDGQDILLIEKVGAYPDVNLECYIHKCLTMHCKFTCSCQEMRYSLRNVQPGSHASLSLT